MDLQKVVDAFPSPDGCNTSMDSVKFALSSSSLNSNIHVEVKNKYSLTSSH